MLLASITVPQLPVRTMMQFPVSGPNEQFVVMSDHQLHQQVSYRSLLASRLAVNIRSNYIFASHTFYFTLLYSQRLMKSLICLAIRTI